MTATPSLAPEPLDVVVVGEALIDIVQSPDGRSSIRAVHLPMWPTAWGAWTSKPAC